MSHGLRRVRKIGLVLGPVLFAMTIFASPIDEVLTFGAVVVLATVFWMAAWWVSEAQLEKSQSADIGSADDSISQLIHAAQSDKSIDIGELRMPAQRAIDVICRMMDQKSPARIALEHALLAMKYEENQKKKTGARDFGAASDFG